MPAMPYFVTSCGQPPLKRTYSCFRGGCLQGGWHGVVLPQTMRPCWSENERFPPHSVAIFSRPSCTKRSSAFIAYIVGGGIVRHIVRYIVRGGGGGIVRHYIGQIVRHFL